MKIEITYVPKGKEIWEFLREMKSKTQKAWFLLHTNVLTNLFNDEECSIDSYMIGFRTDWRLVAKIEKYRNTDDLIDFIDFSACEEPENIFFIDMEN